MGWDTRTGSNQSSRRRIIDDIANIFHNIRGEETAYISSLYSENLYPVSALCLNITSITRSISTIADFNTVSINLSIPQPPRGIALPGAYAY